MRGLRLRVLMALIASAIIVSIAFSYAAVVSRNPNASAKPLYGPADFAPTPGP